MVATEILEYFPSLIFSLIIVTSNDLIQHGLEILGILIRGEVNSLIEVRDSTPQSTLSSRFFNMLIYS